MAPLVKGFSKGIESLVFGNNIPNSNKDPHRSLSSIGLIWYTIIGWATLPEKHVEEAGSRKVEYDTSNFHPGAAITATTVLSLGTIILGEVSSNYIPHRFRFPVKTLTYALALMPLHHVIGLCIKSSRDFVGGRELPPPSDRCQ